MKLSRMGCTELELLELEILAETEGLTVEEYASMLLKQGLDRVAEENHVKSQPVVH